MSITSNPISGRPIELDADLDIDGPVGLPGSDDAFELTDFTDAVKRYLDEDVTVTISAIDPDVSSSMQPGELGTFTVTVHNGPIALEDVWLHLTFEDPTRADFQVPPDGGLLTANAINGNQLPRNSFVDEMFVQHVIGGELAADERQDTELELIARRVGQTDVRCHVHAEVPISSLLKMRRGLSSTTSLVVE